MNETINYLIETYRDLYGYTLTEIQLIKILKYLNYEIK